MTSIQKSILKELPKLLKYKKICKKLAVFLENNDEKKPFGTTIIFSLGRKCKRARATLFWFKNLQSGNLIFLLKKECVLSLAFKNKDKTNRQLVFWVKTQLKDLAKVGSLKNG